MTFPASYCSLCSAALQCHCGTFDQLHENSCELHGILCSDCWEVEIDRIPEGPEPDRYTDYVKDLTLPEIDALLIEHQLTTRGSTPASRLRRVAVRV